MTNLVSAALLGIIQGLGEFLPISSSGHLAILHHFLPDIGFESAITFDVMLHLGTLIAVFIVYFKDICALIPAFFTMLGKVFHKKFKLTDYTTDERLVILLIISCLPLPIAALINDSVDALAASMKIVGVILMLNGVLLFISDLIGKGWKKAEQATPTDAILVGLFQLFAVLPGLSRSGSTITGGLARKYDRSFAVKYSFLLSLPAIIGANIFKIPDVVDEFASAESVYDVLMPAVIGIVCAAVAGFAAMKLLQYIARKSKFSIFGVYCAVIGLLLVIFA